jgi:hypothetical protein
MADAGETTEDCEDEDLFDSEHISDKRMYTCLVWIIDKTTFFQF